MFSRLKYRIFGDAEENALLKALASGKIVISDHEIDGEYCYIFGSYMDSSYITLIRSDAKTGEHANSYATISPCGKLTVFKDGQFATSSKEFKKLFAAAYKIIQKKAAADKAAEEKKEDERFSSMMFDVFGDLLRG